MFAPAVSTAVVGEEFGEMFCCGVSASELKPVQVPATRLAAVWLVPVPLARSTLSAPFAGDQLAPAWAQNDSVMIWPWQRMESSVSIT